MKAGLACAIALFCAFAGPDDAAAQTCTGFPWTVTAAQTNGTSVAIHVCGTYSGCRPRDPRIEVHASEIQVTLTQAVYPNCACLAVVGTFEESVLVPALEPGDYTVKVFNFYCTEASEAGSTDVTVGTAISVPTLDLRGFAALALLMAIVAARRLR